MRPCFGVGTAGRLALDAIISDGGGGRQRLLDIAVVEDAALARGVAPNTGQAVCLELQAHGELVRFVRVALLFGADVLAQTADRLQMMCDLVRNDVRLREVAGRVEPGGELPEEAEIQVDGLVGRAIEGTGRGGADRS